MEASGELHTLAS